jgi:hypothetical protein
VPSVGKPPYVRWAARYGRRLTIAAIVTLGLALAAPSVLTELVGSGGPEPITHVPADNPELGLIYAGLTPARKGEPCVGGYSVGGQRNVCAHGPDAPPAGLNVKRGVAPVAVALPNPTVPDRDAPVGPTEAEVISDDGATAADANGPALAADTVPGALGFTMGASGVACDGDGVTGKRIQVLYVRAASTASRFGQYLESFRTWAAGVDAIYDASAQETGGSRHIRYVTTADCKVDVQEVEIPDSAIGDFGSTNNALKNLGYNRTDRKYMMFADSSVYCGIGTFAGDESSSASNRSNGGPSYGRSDTGCWTASVAAHELGHNLGAVNNSAPNSSKAGHCLDEYDVMCYNDSGGLKTRVVCSDRAHDSRLDCNHDDYYNTNPSAGSYLATHWNVASNDFLIRGAGTGGGGGPSPSASASATATKPPTATPSASNTATSTPTASPSRTVSPSATATGTPTPTATPSPTSTGALTALRVSSTTTTSTRLSWDAAAAGTRYAVLSSGRSLGTVSSTGVRVTRLRPDTEYKFQIAVVRADGGLTPYTTVATVRTKAMAPVNGGAWITLGNAATDSVADLFGARRADGTPGVLYRRTGGTNQVWKLEAVTGGYLLRSKATDRCMAPKAGATSAGTVLVEAACDATNASQVWRVAATQFSVTLSTANGLVLGVGTARFGGSRLLVLQAPNSTRYQNWTTEAI